MRSIPHPDLFLDAASVRAISRRRGPFDGIVAAASGSTDARAYAIRHALPFWIVQPGLFGHLDPPIGPPVACSSMVDDIGRFGDARGPSRLERILLEEPEADLAARGAPIRERIVRERLGRCNVATERPVAGFRGGRPRVLLVDEPSRDVSVRGALASVTDFARMVEEVRCDRPRAEVLVYRPESLEAGPWALRGLIETWSWTVLEETISSHSLLDAVDEVWTVSSLIGFDALLRGMPVSVFGVPFYAGYGPTRDRSISEPSKRALARRTTARLGPDALAGGVLGRYTRYADPIRQRPASFDEIADRLVAARRRHSDLPQKTICVGFSRWKQPMAEAFLGGPGKKVSFGRLPRALASARRDDAALCIWGMKIVGDVEEQAQASGVPFLRLEDGFLRSAGLGSNFVFPASLCLDRRAIYYDATRPSDLEHILATADFCPALIDRARALRRAIVTGAVTKYGMAPSPALLERLSTLRETAGAREIVLVPGQVPDDASIVYGCPRTKTNIDLLKAVRAEKPKAFIVFKIHPDVAARNRAAGGDAVRFEDFADAVVSDGPILPLVDLAAEVHVMSSLAGFEALLRGKRVVTWGAPFFAGWGLTEDRLDHPRRDRRLGLDELVAGALVLYPSYIHPPTLLSCEPEDIVEFLARRAPARAARPGLTAQIGRGLEYLMRMAGVARRKF